MIKSNKTQNPEFYRRTDLTPQNPQNLKTDFKYNYIIQKPWLIRLVSLFAFFSYFGVVFGFVEYLRISTWNMILFGPVIVLVCYTNLGAFFVNIFYPKFDIAKHEEFVAGFWKSNTPPSVDIFLPVAGEALDVIENTWAGVKAVNYSNLTVYVLDDGGSSEVSDLAQKFGFVYLSRKNKGEYNKAGNVQFGLDCSSGDFVFILDADFRPIPESLHETIPYIVSNPKISILQTPQYFDLSKKSHDEYPIQYGAGSMVEEFYRIVLPARIVFGSGKCVGTSAIYRRKAVLEAGGMPKVNGSEDIRIGLETHKLGYFVQYIPLIVSKGFCPDDIQKYFKQQSRWADGTFATIMSSLYFNHHLDTWSKFTYLNSFLHYLMSAITPILSLQLLALLYFNTESIRLTWIIPFVPYLIYFYLIQPRFRLNKFRFGTLLTGLTNILAYSDALIRLCLNKAQKWVPAGKASYKQTSNREFVLSSNIATLFSSLYILAFDYILFVKPYILLNWETWIVLILILKRIYEYGIFSSIIQSFNIDRLVVDTKQNPIFGRQLTITKLLAFLLLLSYLVLGGVFGYVLVQYYYSNPVIKVPDFGVVNNFKF